MKILHHIMLPRITLVSGIPLIYVTRMCPKGRMGFPCYAGDNYQECQ